MQYEFKIISGSVVIGDPCYKRTNSVNIFPAKNGKWVAREEEGGRFLIANHIDHSFNKSDLLYSNLITDSPVDSGQLGLFDNSIYPDEEVGEYKDSDSFYGKCCAITDFAGVVDELGVNARTLYGDGIYPVIGLFDENGNLIGMAVDFAGTFDEECEDWDEEDDDWIEDELDEMSEYDYPMDHEDFEMDESDPDEVYLNSVIALDPDLNDVEFEEEI